MARVHGFERVGVAGAVGLAVGMGALAAADTGLSFEPQASASAAAAQPAATGEPGAGVNPNATFALSNERLTSDSDVLWHGFLTGLRGFEHFYDPIGQPIYFESPFINTSARLLYLHHEFASGSQLMGGHVDVLAAQARLAVTERLAIIATKDGYSWLDAGLLPKDEGWNDIAIGAKYAFIVDRENDFVLTGGARWQWGNGDGKVLQGWSQEISPFVSFAKGFDKLHLIGDLSWRIPLDRDKGNTIFQWDLHADYEILPGLAPCVELHGLHYWTNGSRLPLKVGGLDYANIGSSDVAGSAVVWMGLGARWKLTPNVSVGSTYEFALTNRNADIMDDRVTVDVTLTW
ncbi:MAG TPA: hypothetical protein VHC70_08780 [Phycisphaerales bacterium]|nr:hypothetical protein [Phycisphaerales bacterium]